MDTLGKIKLLMGYDNSKTLNENKKIIFEQILDSKQISDVSKNLRYWLTGDVQSNDLNKIHNELKTKIFGKSSEDGGCAFTKLINYYEKDTKSAGFQDFFGTIAPLTLGLSDAFRSFNLITQIQDSKESGEGGFEDIKSKLLSDINSEINNFCKTNQSNPNQNQQGVEF